MCASLFETIVKKKKIEMKNFILILISTLSMSAFSQELKEKKWILKLNTIQLVDIFSFPTLQISAERKINNFLSINTEFGSQIFDYEKKLDTIYYKPKGFKANVEARIYLSKLFSKRINSKKSEFYIGLQVFYRQNQSTDNVDYSPKIDSTKHFSDTFGTKRKVKGVSLTLGYQFSAGKKIVIEPFLGFGFQNKKIKNTNTSYNQYKDFINGSDLVPLFQKLNLEESSGNDFDFSTGFRIGYRL